jgi:hypothetical protein
MKKPAAKRPRPFACPACGKTFTIEASASNHHRSVDCVLVRTREAYAARGWVRAYSWGKTLAACGFPVERAPTHAGIVPRSEAPKPWCYGRAQPGDLVEVPNDGPWAPGYAVDAAYLFSEVKITAKQRREAILHAIEDEEFAEACRSAKALGGKHGLGVFLRGK